MRLEPLVPLARMLTITCLEIFLVDFWLTLKRHWLTECRIKPVDGWKSVWTGGDSDASARAKTHVHKSFIYSTFWAPQAAQKRLGVDILPRGPFSVEGFRWRHKTEIEVNPDPDVPWKTSVGPGKPGKLYLLMKIIKHDCQLLIRPFGGTDSPYLSSCCRRGWGCPVHHLRLRSFGKNFVWIFKALTWGGRNSWSLIHLHDCNYTSGERCGTFRGGYM